MHTDTANAQHVTQLQTDNKFLAAALSCSLVLSFVSLYISLSDHYEITF